MRETPITIRDLNKGLARRKPNLNELEFTECKNFVYKDKMVESFQPFDVYDNTTDNFFPQTIKGKGFDFYIEDTDIFYIVEGKKVKLILLDYITHKVKRIIASSTWKLIDYGRKWYLINDRYMITNIPDYDDGQYAFVYSNVYGDCGTYFKGRGIIAGFYDDYVSEGWDNTLGALVTENSIPLTEDGMVKKNFIFWSGIGQNLEYALFPDKISQEDYIRMIEENTFGYMAMNWSGRVMETITLGDNLIVFGSNGISLVYAEGPSIGQKTISDKIGLLKRDSISIGTSGILFIGSDYNLYLMGYDGKLNNLYYADLFRNKTDIRIISKDNFFLINVDDKSYIFYDSFLTEIGQRVTGFVGDKAICNRNIDTRKVLKINRTNFGYNNKKQITFVDFGIDQGEFEAQVTADVVYKTKWVKMIRNKNLYFGISGDTFELELIGNFSFPNYITIRMLSLDHNQIRGQYVS